MPASEAHITQEVLLICDMLDVEKQEITLEAVNRRLIQETGYEYPHGTITQVIQQRDMYVWNVKTHGYEKRHD